MHLRDISLKKRLLITNALMVIIPIVLMLTAGTVLLGGLRYVGTLQQQALALLWPEKGTSLSVQFALSSLHAEAEKKKIKLHNIESDLHLLEGAGVRISVEQQGKRLYLSPDTDPGDLQRAALEKHGRKGSSLIWDKDGLFFRWENPRSGVLIIGAGDVPMTGSPEEALFSHDERDFILNALLILVLLVTSAGILLLGRYLAHILSAQILTPLTEIRAAAAAMQQGDFDRALPETGDDEVGMTCRAFDAMRRDLKRARAREQQEEERRRELFIGVLHDVATPLTAIKGYASGLLEGIAATPEKQRKYTERIIHAAETMEGLTTRLRTFLRLESGQSPFSWEDVDARAYVHSAVAEAADDFAEQGVFLSMADTPCRAVIRIDRMEFTRVLRNLWENSGKYRRGDSAHVRISLAEEAGVLAIDIDDDGMGAAPEELPRLFDSFYRTDPARANVAAGSGFGLAVVRQIVTASGGTVRAAASPLGGLRIHIEMPIAGKQKDQGDSG